MKKYLFIILISFQIIGCDSDDTNSNNNISDNELNEIGNKLADWGNSNCSIITINNKNILWQGPNAGGCSPIGFEFNSVSSILGEDTVNSIQNNLRELINDSNCDISELKNNILNITSDSNNDMISQYLDCIGAIEILDGDFGEE
jgi:hypothetical protein